MNRLGERIKRKREILNFPLNELAKKVGISSSALSQIENSKSFPSILTLKSIADNLFTSVGELIGENEILAKHPLVKNTEIKFAKTNNTGTSLFLLSYHDNSKQMEPYLMVFSNNSDSEDMMFQHPGQEFIFVLEGKLIVSLGNNQYILEKEDNFYFNSSIPHSLKNIGQASARVLWIITPPNI